MVLQLRSFCRAVSSTIGVWFRRHEKCSFQLCLISSLSLESTPSLSLTGADPRDVGPYSFLVSAKNSLVLFRSAKFCNSTAFSVHQSFCIFRIRLCTYALTAWYACFLSLFLNSSCHAENFTRF